METHLKAKEYADIERCWELARTEADRLVKTFHQVMHPEPPTPEFDSITDPIIQARFESSRIAANRRQILFRAARIYIRSLLAQDDSAALQRVQRTIRNLLTNGFVIDNLEHDHIVLSSLRVISRPASKFDNSHFTIHETPTLCIARCMYYAVLLLSNEQTHFYNTRDRSSPFTPTL
ncbi:hypothetical protein CC80DRAFT_549301 [Byssothecium circinans]|uniref:Uncharacterized protein n=1 Tax=Byssothecium circinans TaxID=147558 RepID=A0A6A5TUB8_9PLEO|nr:hypothetical protein CC80DRAFT_549301 [Byssothecium circinans]